MDPLEEFLSPEALRLLLDSDDFAITVNEPSVTTADQSLSIITPLAAGVNIPISAESKPTRKRLAPDANITGCSTLVLDKAGSAKPKRAKFNAEGRAKVANVRKKGACMKCHRNKIPCSGEWPCESCCRSRAVIAGRASRHRWMDCVPFSMRDLDVFAEGIVQEDYLADELLRRNFGFARFEGSYISIDEERFSTTTKSSGVLFSFNVDNIRTSFGRPARNRSTPRPKLLISSCADSRLEKAFKLAIIANPLTCRDKDSLIGEDLWNARSVAGSRLLQCLEKALSNSSLSSFDAETLLALIQILCLTISAVHWRSPRVLSLPGVDDKQQQLICVLMHHVVYIGERVNLWKGLEKENIMRRVTSIAERFMPLYSDPETKPHGSNNFSHTMHNRFSGRDGHGKAGNYSNQGSPVAENSLLCPTDRCKQPLEETSEAMRRRKSGISQPTLYAKADTVSGQENDWPIVQRHANAKSPYLLDTRPEDRYPPLSNGNQIGPAISKITPKPLPELQIGTVCGWCGSFQISYKPSQGMVSCDICFTPYQPTTSTLPGWDLGQDRSMDQSFNPARGLDTSQGDSTNYAAWPDVTTSSSYGNDIDDFSWFMAS